jgi:hypothetical protein
VEVQINPPPSQQLPSAELDELIDGHLSDFERWFIERQRKAGNPSPTGLIGVEGSILKTYVKYLYTKETP